MTDSPIVKIMRDPLLSRTITAAVIADGLLLLPFFFTSNLFSKILPSGNLSSLVVLLVFSLVALRLSNNYVDSAPYVRGFGAARRYFVVCTWP